MDLDPRLDLEKELAKEELNQIIKKDRLDLLPSLFDDNLKLYSLALAIEELKKDNKLNKKQAKEIQSRILDSLVKENDFGVEKTQSYYDFLHYTIIAEEVYKEFNSNNNSNNKNNSSFLTKIKKYLKPISKMALVSLLIASTVYASGCLANDHGNTTSSTISNNTTTTSTIEQKDNDNDGISDYDEINLYHTDPKKPNPVLSYIIKNGLNQTLYENLKILDEDGEMDKNEKELIDALVFIQNDLIPDNIKVYYPEKKETKLMGSFKLLYPKDYLSRNDILFWQKELISSVLADRKISDMEIISIKKLENEKRWWVVRDIIDSGMINDRYLDDDWDGDGISNIEEICQGTNPLNDLEVNPDNLSERWAIIVNGIDIDAYYVGNVYHLLKRSGYDDNHIIWFHYNPNPKETFEKIYAAALFPWMNQSRPDNSPVGQLLPPGYLLYIENYPNNVQIDFNSSQTTPENFLNAIKTLSSDDNDIVFIYYSGHGPGPLGSLGVIPADELNKALASIRYGRLIYIQDSCPSEDYLSILGKEPFKLNQTLVIWIWAHPEYIFSKLDLGESLKDAFGYCKEKEETMKDKPFVEVYYFNDSGEINNWWDHFSPVKYLPKNGS